MHLLQKPVALALLLLACSSMAGCTTLTGKTSPTSASPKQTAATAPMGADIQQILAAGGIDPGTASAEPVQVADAPPAPAAEAPVQVAALPESPPVAEAELSQPGVQNIGQDQIYTFPTPAISMMPSNFEPGLGSNPFPAPVNVLPSPPMEERIVVISGPDAQPIEKPKKRAAAKPAPAAKPECIRLAQANVPDPECPPLAAPTAVSTGPVWQAPAITANVATPAAPVKRF